MKLEIRLETDDTYSIVDTHFDPFMCDPAGMYPKNKALVTGLTKDNAQAVLKIADMHKIIGYRGALSNAITTARHDLEHIDPLKSA